MGGFTAVVNFLMLFIFLAVGISFLYYYNVQTIADYSDFIETTKADSLKFEENAYSLQGPILYSGEKYLVLRNDGEKSIILRDEGVNIFDIYKNGRILNESEFRFVLPMNTSAIYDFIEPNSYALLYFNEEIEKGDNISFISQRGIELEYEYLGDYWWDNSWFGRSDINVYNPSSENLFEYQVEVDLVKENFDFKFAKPENFRTMVPLEEYLILALPFENYLQQTNDSSGFNHKVVLGSDVSSNPSDPAFANSSGFRSNGLYFDGVNDYVTVEDDDVFDNLEKFSLSFWFKPDTLTGDPVGIVSKRNNFNDNAAFSVFIWSGNQINVDIDTSNDRFSSNYVVKEDEWQNVVLVFDGTLDPSQRVKLYVDGELDGVYSESSDMIPKYNSQFTIGTMDEGYPDYFNGHIDEVQMYDLALNEDEVEDIYNDELMIFRELDFYVDKYDYLEEEG
ncbi:MAG: LamG domain-containing protein, partial [Nanoarchaeota archaeon]